MRDFSIDLIWTKIQIAFTALGGWLGYFLGGMDGLMIALIVLMTLDYISGVMCAIIDKKLSSAVGFKGVCKKVFILMLVGVAHIIDLHVVGTGSALRGTVICFYMSNEGLSLLENAAHVGLPIPDKLKDTLRISQPWNEPDGNLPQSALLLGFSADAVDQLPRVLPAVQDHPLVYEKSRPSGICVCGSLFRHQTAFRSGISLFPQRCSFGPVVWRRSRRLLHHGHQNPCSWSGNEYPNGCRSDTGYAHRLSCFPRQ